VSWNEGGNEDERKRDSQGGFLNKLRQSLQRARETLNESKISSVYRAILSFFDLRIGAPNRRADDEELYRMMR
jgi:hypothetical protein